MKIRKLSIIALLLLAAACTNAQRNNKNSTPKSFSPNNSPFKNYLGINAFEWDFSDDDNTMIPAGRMAVMRSFGGLRHYMDWDKLETEQGKYTFNPVHSGGWNYDMIYKWCKEEGIDVLADLKTCPSWLLKTYPEDQRNAENVPAPYGLDRNKPSTYVKQAKVAFQFAARYGRNTAVPKELMSVNPNPRWTNDPVNQVRIGLGYVKYIECDNERDKTWRGPQAHQNAEEYAANMSAFYDGHKGTLGKNVGIKTADPTMQVVMGGLADPDIEYVIKMIEWCKKNRGYKADGSVDLCFDVINYHAYNNDYNGGADATIGKAPDMSMAARIADEFVTMSKKYAKGMEVWITESGYDLNPKSPQRAVATGSRTALITQADWMLRSSFLYARHGLKRSFYYMLDDLDPNATGPYASSGFAEGHKRRPVADYFLQTKKLIGNFTFVKSLSVNPVVDIYGAGGRKVYVLYLPDDKDRKFAFTLNMGTGVSSAKIYRLAPGADEMKVETVAAPKGKLNLTLTETPVFVEKN